MAVVQKVKDAKKQIRVKSKIQLRNDFRRFFSSSKYYIFGMLIFSIFSPVAFLVLFIYLIMKFNREIYTPVFANDIVLSAYMVEFGNTVADKGKDVFSIFGYTIEPEEWDRHKKRLSNLSFDYNVDSEKLQEILKTHGDTLATEAKKVSKNQKYKEFGIGKDFLTRHILFVGTTGAGKTETLMSFFSTCLKVGGGIIFLDGKADMGMWAKMYALAKKQNRETSFVTINYLKPETNPDTNTYSPVSTMSVKKATTFLASLLGSGGDGNADYFKNRGIAMLDNVMAILKFRKEYYGEAFSMNLLQSMNQPLSYTNLYILSYCAVREINDLIKLKVKTEKEYNDLWNLVDGKTTPTNIDMEYYEKVLKYVLEIDPSAREDIEKLLGFDFKYFERLFEQCFRPSRSYIKEILSLWDDMSTSAAKVVYSIFKDPSNSLNPNKTINTFRYDNENHVKMEDIIKITEACFNLEKYKSSIESSLKNIIPDESVNFLVAFGGDKREPASLRNMPQDALQQHGFAQQQWTNLFKTFDMFPHVFGSPNPDIDMKDVVANNKILYILLPPLELGKETVEVLGKMIVRDLQIATAESLGGEKMLLTPKQQKIFKDKITPKPLSIITLDEYGAYPVEGIDTLLAQVRSINFSVIISVQDFVSLKVGGSDETSLKRALANTSKLFLKSYDDDVKDFLDKQMPEEEILVDTYHKDVDGKLSRSYGADLQKEKEKRIDPTLLSDMMYGCGIYIADSKAIIVQSYYRGGEEATGYIGNFRRFDNT